MIYMPVYPVLPPVLDTILLFVSLFPHRAFPKHFMMPTSHPCAIHLLRYLYLILGLWGSVGSMGRLSLRSCTGMILLRSRVSLNVTIVFQNLNIP